MSPDSPRTAPSGTPLSYQQGHVAVRARSIASLQGEGPARGMKALTAPLNLLDDGVIVAENGVIRAVEPYCDFRRRVQIPEITCHDLGDVLLTPGFINCHTHLELSHMKDKTVRGQGFAAWMQSLITHIHTPGQEQDAENALQEAVASMAATGTAAVMDITERRPERVRAALDHNAISPRLLLEVFGFAENAMNPFAEKAATDVAFSLAGHAPYSTSIQNLTETKRWCDVHDRPFSVHLAEATEELACLKDASGDLCAMLRVRVLPKDWRAPGKHPVRLAQEAGLLTPGTLAVHCVHCGPEEVAILANSGAAVCLCPRSNVYIGVGEAPAGAFAASGALLTLGTDSLSSNDDLTLWNEAEYFLQKNIFPPNALLRMMTVNGATAARISQITGTLAAGSRFWYSLFPRETSALFTFA